MKISREEKDSFVKKVTGQALKRIAPEEFFLLDELLSGGARTAHKKFGKNQQKQKEGPGIFLYDEVPVLADSVARAAEALFEEIVKACKKDGKLISFTQETIDEPLLFKLREVTEKKAIGLGLSRPESREVAGALITALLTES